MRIAIIGTGNVGGAIAQGLKNKGHAVTLGARDPDAPAMITLEHFVNRLNRFWIPVWAEV
jgi:3-hydroxyisobutyrate dehydrogenase-like beta-hydroxyacid dehydrogenase